MVLLRSTVCLLLIIAFPEANSIKCSSTCESDITTENAVVQFKCDAPSTGDDSPTLTWYVSPLRSELTQIPAQKKEGDLIRRDFNSTVVKPLPELYMYCTDDKEPPCPVPACKILYSPKNVVTSLELFVSPGENITCKAEGNPKPTFKWEENVDGSWKEVSGADGETYTAELKDGATYIELRCVATNKIGSTYSAMVFVSKYGNKIRNAIIIGVVVIVVVAGVIAGIVYACKK